jgi:hypothetical protein
MIISQIKKILCKTRAQQISHNRNKVIKYVTVNNFNNKFRNRSIKTWYHGYIDCRIVHLLILQKFQYVITHRMKDVKMVTGGLKFHFESLICANLVYQLYALQMFTHSHTHTHTQSMCVCAHEHMSCFCTEIMFNGGHKK